MDSFEELRHQAEAAHAAFKTKLHLLYATLGMGLADIANGVADGANQLLSFLPSVQAYLDPEWVKFIGVGVTVVMTLSAMRQAYKTSKSNRLALNAAIASAAASAVPADPVAPAADKPADGGANV